MSLLSRPERLSRIVHFFLWSFLAAALSGSADGSAVRSVRVSWSANPERDIAHYRLQYGTSATALDQVVTGPGTSAVVGGLAAGTTYYFSVQAVNTSGLAGEASAVASYRTSEAIVAAPPEIRVLDPGGAVLENGGNGLSFGSMMAGGPYATTLSLAIANDGGADLAGLRAVLAGGAAGDFAIVRHPVATVVPGGRTVLDVSFQPTATGLRTAVLEIASNDPTQAVFRVALSGTGTLPLASAEPEIAVQRDGAELVDGAASIGFGNVLPGVSSAAVTLTIRNAGTAALTGIAASLGGSHPGDFSVTAPAASVAAGGTATMTVRFRPAALGPRNAVLRISSNDADENPFDIALSGNGLATPEIAVLDDTGADRTSGGATLSFGSVAVRDGRGTRSVTVRNIGTAPLTNLAASLTGSHAGDFRVGGVLPQTLVPGAEATLALEFSPTASGTRSAALRIASNDSDENPFAIALSGVGTVAPQIELIRVSTATSVAESEFGGVEVGRTAQGGTYAIRNSGTANLSEISLSLIGPHAGEFAFTALDTKSLAPGATTSFTLSFTPRAAGRRVATLRIFSNDPQRNPLELALAGNGSAFPEIVVADDRGQGLSGGATAAFGAARTGETGGVRTFVIRNTGAAPLRNVRAACSGAAARDFTIVRHPAKTIPPGSRGSVAVRFHPQAPGNRRAVLTIFSDDRDESRIAIPLSGSGVATPRIRVSAGSKKLKDGDSFVSFGRGTPGRKGKTRSIRITNTGTAPLNGIRIRKGWLNAGDFKVGKLKTKSLAPGRSVTVKVTFVPRSNGNRWAELHIASNAYETQSFKVMLNGVGNGEFAGKPTKKSSLRSRPTSAKAADLDARKLIVRVGGQRYRALAIRKSRMPAADPRDVQVSGNLIEWASGPRHTVVVRETKRLLIVRDRVPLDGGKRHIRLNPRR